tara:strand:- start:1613 stop:2284 length:672 start_codon:yes stop_codon:yes gene_type:complete
MSWGIYLDSIFKADKIKAHRETLLKRSEETPYTVFLCGPTIQKLELEEKRQVTNTDRIIRFFNRSKHSSQAILRKRIKDELEAKGFDVVLGEDDGLENARIKVGLNAQDNELEFIMKHCDAVIIVAGSVGSFCELGLFSWHYTNPSGSLKNTEPEKDFILLIDQRYKKDISYFNEGPAKVVRHFGETIYIDFKKFDVTELVDRLQSRKSLVGKDGRGRPRKQS